MNTPVSLNSPVVNIPGSLDFPSRWWIHRGVLTPLLWIHREVDFLVYFEQAQGQAYNKTFW